MSSWPDDLAETLDRAGFREDCEACQAAVAHGREACPIHYRAVADRAPRSRLPTGVELPSGRVLTYPAARECGCADCEEAFEALDAGELTLPERGEAA